ncbi:MAG: hypothetical protein Q6370_003385, partial [Candidatus Sigynarchaeota archaeon]
YNERTIILDNGLGAFRFWLHRKQCPACGEVPMDLSVLVPPRCRYPENFKRRARLHYMDGLPPLMTLDKPIMSLLMDQIT